jgi:hypothetical protein
VWQVHKAKHDGITVEFFPVYYFVVTCAVGTLLQGAFYGMAFGWLSGVHRLCACGQPDPTASA